MLFIYDINIIKAFIINK